MSAKSQIVVEGKAITVSNLEKILYPQAGFTKGEVLKYYIEISPVLLPHLQNRPLTLKRYPEGVEGFFFYEKNCPAHRPDWIETAKVPRQRKSAEKIDYCVLQGLPALVWAVNLADLELHTFLHQVPEIDCPTCIAFDLDPGPGVTLVDCGKVAVWIKEILDSWRIQSFPKTSGSKGLQLYIPINSPTSYSLTKPLAKAIAEYLANRHPELVVSQMTKIKRTGKVFIDWSQNDAHKTTISVYSLRAKEQPLVSTPLEWKEIQRAVRHSNPDLLVFGPEEVLRRVEKSGDLFAPVLSLKQKLSSAMTLP